MSLQAKFLQVLDEGHITPLGGTQRKPVDVRVVVATNANLQAKIAEGLFRRDLYHRLAHYPINISPLRERREDIPLLVDYFLEHFAMEMGRDVTAISPQAMQALMDYHFPGNVRELRNMIERALIRSGHKPIQSEHLDFLSLPLPAANPLPAPASLGFPPTLSPNRMEVLLIKGTLVETNGDVEAAARLLKMRPDHIRALRQDPSPPPLNAAEERILAYVRESGGITNRSCCQLLDININQAYRLLDKLDRTGSLVREGKRRWAVYHLP